MTIAVIGLGGAGGNIANEASLNGMQAGAINFSQKDLDALNDVKYKLKIMGSEGVGHNRNIAINLIQEHYEMAVSFIRENFSSPMIDIIVFAFASSGGSGAGASPILLDIMTNIMPEKTFVAMPIIPDETESTISQSNCSKTFEELTKLDVCILPVDNGKVKSMDRYMGKGRMYELSNKQAVSLLKKLSSYTEKYSKNGNFDRKDLATILRQGGMANISEVEIASLPSVNLTPEGVAAIVQESWDESIFAPIEYDQVIRAGIIFDGQESLMQFVDHQLIFERFENKMPIDLFEGNYHEHKGKIVTILTGLSWSRKRFAAIDKLIEEGSRKIEQTMNKSSIEYQAKSVSLDISLNQKTSKSQQSVMDILSRYKR